MSRSDLEQIQTQLKVAIQSHQILVAKMKGDPQNPGLQKQLHEVQSQITSLSEKQKSVVQLLRKELVSKQVIQHGQVTTGIVSSTNNTLSSLVSHGLPVGRVAIPPPQTAPTNLSTKPINTQYAMANNNTSFANNNKVNNNNNNSISAASPSGGSVAILAGHRLSLPGQLLAVRHPRPVAPSGIIHGGPKPKPSMPGSQPGNTEPPKSTSPPIKVPQYSIHRPSILQGRKPALLKSNVNTTVNVGPMQKSSDADISDAKRASLDRKEIPPEQRKKLEYMATLDLITPETLKELQSKRSERKRRSTANPQFSYGHYEPERKRNMMQYLANTAAKVPTSSKKAGGTGHVPKRRGRPPKNPQARSPACSRPESPATAEAAGAVNGLPPSQALHGGDHEDYCAVCQRSGELLMCDTCSLVYHLQCLEPALTTIPTGLWSCPKCQAMNKNNPDWPGTLALVHTYIAHKAAKEEEKKKLMRRSQELAGEKEQLEKRANQLRERLAVQMKQQTDMSSVNRVTQQNVDKLKSFIKFFQTS